MNRRFAWIAALVALVAAAALSVAPASLAALAPLGGAKGQATLNACDAASGANGFVKWDVAKLEVNVTIPTLKGQLATLDARYLQNGVVNRLKQDFTVAPDGRAVLKFEGAAVPQGSLARVDIINPAAPLTDPFGGHVLTTAALPCA